MKKWLLLLWLGPWLTAMAGDVEVSGYFEPQYTGLQVRGQFYNLASNKLRVDLASDISDQVSFGANFDYITFHGKTSWNILDFLPESIAEQIPRFQRKFFTFNFGDMVQAMGPVYSPRPDRIFLDNAFMRLSFKRLDLTVGRQQISLGTGYTWNPTDLFNTKSVLDPTYEQPGHNAIRADVALSNRFNLVCLFAPGEQWKDSARLIKLKGGAGHFDFSLLAFYKDLPLTDYTFFAQGKFRRMLLGGDFAGELLGLGVWGEGGYSKITAIEETSLELDDFWELVLGTDYTFESGLYVMAEFYHNSMAKKDWRQYGLNDWMWMLTTETKTMTRDQLFGMWQYPASDLATIGMMSIASLSDGSAAIVPMLLYSLFEDVDLTAYANFYTGKSGRAYASNMGNGLLLRLRVYF